MKRRHALLIDTGIGQDNIELLLADEQAFTASSRVNFSSTDSQSLLAAVLDLLHSGSLNPPDLVGIGVVPGAERFTVSRLSAVVANALSWSLALPVREFAVRPSAATLLTELTETTVQAAQSGLIPRYSKDPTITLG